MTSALAERLTHRMNLKTVCWVLALSAAFLYLLCVAYGLMNRAAGQMREFLKILLPAG